tara:strand:+ start:6471 stop:6605 length:135 start_codon:yes stop_codon:yes gene_type:complete
LLPTVENYEKKNRQKEIKLELDRTYKNKKQETPLEIPITKGIIN